MAAGDLNIKLSIDTKDAVGDLNNFFNTYSQNAGKAARDLDAALGGKVEKEIVISLKDDKPLAKLEISAEQVSRKLGTLGQALEGSFAGTTKVLKRQISLLEDLQENTRKFSRKTGEVTPEWKKLESAIAAAKNKLATFDSKALAKVKEEASQAAARLGKLGQALQGGLANTPRVLSEQLSLLQDLQQDTAKFNRKTGEVTAEWKKVADAIAAAKAKLASFSDKPLPKPELPKQDDGAARGKLQQAMSGSFANTPKVLKEQIALLENLKESTAKFNRKTGEVTEEWKKLNKIIGQAKDKLAKFGPGPLEQLKASLQGVIGRFVAVQTLSNLATGALQALGAAIVNVFQSGMKMELLSLQLETFTGGAQQAEAAMAKFIDIAIKTPFNIEQVAEAAKILMAYGIEADSAVEATERLAIAGSTSGAQLDNLSRNLGQIQAQGRAYTRDLTQFAIQGIPIWDALSQVTGKTTVELKKMAEEGTVSFDMVNGALAAATKEGTALWVISQKMQETMTGRFEAIASAIQVTAGAFLKMIQDFDNATGIVSGLFNIVKGTVQGLGAAFKMIGDNMKAIIPIVGGITVGLTTLFTIAKWSTWIAGIATVIQLLWQVVVVQKAIAAWQIIVNALSGPKGWINIAAALSLGVAAYAGLNAMVGKHAEEREKENQKLEEAAEKYKTVQERQKELIDQYGTIEGKTMSFGEQLKALEEAYKKGDISAADYAKKLAILRDEMAALMPAAETAKQKIEELDKQIKKLKTEQKDKGKLFDERLKGIEASKKAEDSRHKKEKQNIDDAKKGVNEAANAAVKAIDQKKEAENAYHEAAMAGYEEQSKQAQASAEASNRRIESEKAKIQEESAAKIASLQASASAADRFHEKRMGQIRAESEAAIAALDREKQKISEKYNAQIAAVEALSPAEQELAAMRTAELQQKAANVNLTRKERLEAQAQLDQMARQQQVAELKKKQKQEEMAYEEKITALKEKQQALEAEQEQRHKNTVAAIQQSIAAEQKHAEEKIKALEEEAKRAEEKEKAEQERINNAKEAEQDRHDSVMEMYDAEKEEITEKKDQDLKALEERSEAEDNRHEKAQENLDAEKENIEKQKEESNKYYEDRIRQLEDMKTKIKEEGKAVENTTSAVGRLKEMYAQVVKEIEKAIVAQNKLNTAVANGKAGSGAGDRGQGAGAGGGAKLTSDANTNPKSPNQRGSAFRAAGGPVAGGSVYTVNELGQEAFLSAAGRLSMINAPSWGQWRAPGAGTVIPAHITSNLAIPSGGVKVNTGAGSRAGAGSTGLAAAVNKLGAMMSPGNVVNNVSVQSTNPTKTASDMLVQLTKIRRNRYS